ncbi:uncharacterized protein LACBIDRAFT_299611 [Laccaria bicolor S238N-H82]|uniref:Predicted protein n=1 Tax=Laccaria bicolor (strain S238N-H82 / ATCC MYA-4686) TaxID=486041 RepID=B0DEZ3_LACBS|nr:uncharacterized protein LACBIDRAFT_299611 [Laccaria bicolor S238N-H82]EDR06756.1 predicted protein [Laccaria bicolor S238N-H82]|eukprot:XP_001882603.1 predicted protein [Laccaria bicolor S238N-H82]
MFYAREGEKAWARMCEEMNRQAEAKAQRKAERNASLKNLLPRALGIFRFNRNLLSSAKSTAESSLCERDSMDKESKTVSCA